MRKTCSICKSIQLVKIQSDYIVRKLGYGYIVTKKANEQDDIIFYHSHSKNVLILKDKGNKMQKLLNIFLT